MPLLEETPGRASLEKLGCRTPPQLHAGGVGLQQQQHGNIPVCSEVVVVVEIKASEYCYHMTRSSRFH